MFPILYGKNSWRPLLRGDLFTTFWTTTNMALPTCEPSIIYAHAWIVDSGIVRPSPASPSKMSFQRRNGHPQGWPLGLLVGEPGFEPMASAY